MKNDKIISAFDSVAADDEMKSRVWEKACQKQQRRGVGRKLVFSILAAAAVFCLAFFGSPMLKGENEEDLFTITAYALSESEDGSIRLTEVDMVDDRPEYWGGLIDDEAKTIYVGLNFRCEGADLASVEVSTRDGFFARQYIGDLEQRTADKADLLYVGPEGHLVLAGPDFEIVGDSLTFDRESLNDYLFFWGTTYEVPPGADTDSFAPDFPDELRFQAKATLENGKTVEQEITIALSDRGANIVSYLSPEEIAAEEQRIAAHRRLMELIPLEECVLDEERTQHGLTYGDTFKYLADGPEIYFSFTINEETPQLLSTFGGALRISAYLPTDGSDGHYVTLNNNGDGTFSVITHIVPGEVIMRYYDGGPAYQGAVYTQSENPETVALSDIGITLLLPEDWKGRYGVDPPGKNCDFYSVYSTEAREAFCYANSLEDEGGVLFFIKKWDQRLTREEWRDPSGEWNYARNRYLKATEDGTYLLYYASDVQYTPETEDEYRQMYDEIDQIMFVNGALR